MPSRLRPQTPTDNKGRKKRCPQEEEEEDVRGILGRWNNGSKGRVSWGQEEGD